MSQEREYNYTALEIPTVFSVLHLSSVLALALNVFAIYVIWEHSPPKMKTYSRYLLLLQIFTTILDLVMMWLVAPWFTYPVMGMIPTGPLVAMGVSTGMQGLLGGAAIVLFGLSIVELFFQRQQTIVPQGSIFKLEPWKKHVWHCFLVVFAIGSLTFAGVIIHFNECDRGEVVKEFPTLQPYIAHKNFLCLNYDSNMHLLGPVAEAVLIPIFFFLILSSIYFLYNYEMFSKKTRDMQRTLLKILIIQTLAPCVFLLAPGAVIYYITLTGDVNLFVLCPWILVMFSLHGPSSTCLILMLYTPYRRFVKSLFGVDSSKATRGTSISMQPGETTMYNRTTLTSANSVGVVNNHFAQKKNQPVKVY